MEEIIEQYGVSILGLLGGAGMLAVFGKLIHAGGVLSAVLLQYMNEICG